MAEVGILSALSGRRDWSSIRDERRRELQLQTLMTGMQEQKLQQEMMAGAAMQEAMSVAGKLKVLKPAIDEITAINDELKAPIREGLKAVGGDVRKYLLGGGQHDLVRYQNNLLNHEAVQRGLMSAFNYNKYTKDVQDGLNPRGNAAEEINNYMSGNSNYFNYRGAYKRPNYDAATHFSAQYGKDRYKQEAVHPEALYRYIFEAAKKENLSDADAHELATNDTNQYLSSVKGGANPFYYKQEDPLKKQLYQSQIYKNYKEGETAAPGADWLYAFVQTNPFDKNRNFVPSEGGPTQYKDMGFGMFSYNMGFDLAKGVSNAMGYEIDKDGQVVNKNNAIAKNNFYVGKDKLDFSGLTNENIKSFQPTGRAVKVYDDNGNLVNGIEYEVRLNEPGVEKLKFGGMNVDGLVSDKPIPFAKQQDNEGFGWWGASGDDYSLSLKVVEPISSSPQVFEEYRRIMSRNSPSAVKGTNASFGYAGAVQNSLLDEGDNLLYGE
jgi:hypothetical protein